MATTIYTTGTINLIDGTEIFITPLKIRYLREFMDLFELVKLAKDDMAAVRALAECARVCMKQYYPQIKTIDDLEDNLDLPSIYKILDVAAGIKINSENEEETVKEQATESGSSWETLDLAKLESEVFLLGIWKDYEELEISLSMPEILATLNSKRDLDYQEKKFLAAIQGVDLEKDNNKSTNAWEDMKARVFSKGQAKDSNDVLSLQGVNAQKAGFGIGMGLSYEKLDE